MIFSAIYGDVYQRMRYQTAPAATVITRLKAFINETQQELADDPRLQSLLRGEMTFATVASQAEYGLPPIIARLVNVRDAANRRVLRPLSRDAYRALSPSQTSQTGTPDWYVPLGSKPVKLQPVATGVWASSTSAGDTSPQVSIEAVRTGGYPHSPAATALTGTSRVQIGSQADYIEILDFYLSAVPVGDVTLFDASTAGNVLAVIPKGQTRVTYPWVAFLLTPSAILTYNLDYEWLVSDLVNDKDEPYWLPNAFHRMLSLGARRKEYEYQDDDRLSIVTNDWNVALLKLLAYVNNGPDYTMIPGRTGTGISDLGAWYPPGTVWD